MIESKTFTNLLPVAPGKCPQCAVVHLPEEPHDNQSVFYQYQFKGLHSRWPTWDDAMSHCTPEVQELWRSMLKEYGLL